jgi:predicted DNA-binding transcriptional regulator AlpA
MTNKPQLLDNREAAEFLGVSPTTLITWRCVKRYDLPYIRVGRKIFYCVEDLLRWLESRKVTQ